MYPLTSTCFGTSARPSLYLVKGVCRAEEVKESASERCAEHDVGGEEGGMRVDGWWFVKTAR